MRYAFSNCHRNQLLKTMTTNQSCSIEDVMQFACALKIGSIFTLKMLVNLEGWDSRLWSKLTKADRENLASQWAAWAHDGLVLSKGVLRPYGKLISGEALYIIEEWLGEEYE